MADLFSGFKKEIAGCGNKEACLLVLKKFRGRISAKDLPAAQRLMFIIDAVRIYNNRLKWLGKGGGRTKHKTTKKKTRRGSGSRRGRSRRGRSRRGRSRRGRSRRGRSRRGRSRRGRSRRGRSRRGRSRHGRSRRGQR